MSATIEGLIYRPDFVTPEEETTLLQHIDAQPWLSDLKRRVQHYGYRYDYKARSVNAAMRLGPLPGWSLDVVRRLEENKLIPETPDQLIINEYHPGQGIAAHVDCVPCFTGTIVSLSLGSSCVIDFKHKQTREVVSLLLMPRSLIVMSGPARYDWTHGIAGRKSDDFAGKKWPRGRRVSLTYRKVIVQAQEPEA
jgi:alkylated DNA repair dioxygenase AlkB